MSQSRNVVDVHCHSFPSFFQLERNSLWEAMHNLKNRARLEYYEEITEILSFFCLLVLGFRFSLACNLLIVGLDIFVIPSLQSEHLPFVPYPNIFTPFLNTLYPSLPTISSILFPNNPIYSLILIQSPFLNSLLIQPHSYPYPYPYLTSTTTYFNIYIRYMDMDMDMGKDKNLD